MSDFVCVCGRDCRSQMALDKHTPVCPAVNRFTNRFTDKDRCPNCSMYQKSFYRKDDETYVCLECGTHFTPNKVLNELRFECSSVSWKRG